VRLAEAFCNIILPGSANLASFQTLKLNSRAEIATGENTWAPRLKQALAELLRTILYREPKLAPQTRNCFQTSVACANGDRACKTMTSASIANLIHWPVNSVVNVTKPITPQLSYKTVQHAFQRHPFVSNAKLQRLEVKKKRVSPVELNSWILTKSGRLLM